MSPLEQAAAGEADGRSAVWRMTGLFARLILRPLCREPARGLLSLAGVALGVAVMLAIQLANRGALGGFSAAIDAVAGRAALQISCPPLGIEEERFAELAWLREFGVAAPVVEADVVARTGDGEEVLRVLGIDALRDPALREYALQNAPVVAGLDLMRFLSRPDTLLLTRGFAGRHGLRAGDQLTLLAGDRRREGEVSAVIGGDSPLAEQALAIMDLAHAQLLLDRPGRLDRIDLRLHDGLAVEQVEQQVRARLPVGLQVDRPQRRSAAVETMLAAFHFNLTMLSGIALLVGLFLIHNTIAVAVMTRRREIGLWRTLGLTRGQVLRCFLGEALLLGLGGALLGVPLAKLLAEGAVALTATTVDTLYVATAARVPALDSWHWLAAVGIAVPLALMAAAVPALEASRVSPVEALRDDSALSGHGPSRLRGRLVLAALVALAGFLAALQRPVAGLPLWGYGACLAAIVVMALLTPVLLRTAATLLHGTMGRLLGIEGRLAAAQIRASAPRLAVSVAALAVSLALAAAIAIMVGSFRQTVHLWIDQSMGADLYVRPGTPARSRGVPTLSQATLDALTGHPALAAADAYCALDLPFRDRVIKLGTGDFAVQIEHGRMVMKTAGDPKQMLRQAREKGEIFVSESLAMRFGVREGGWLELPTPKGAQVFRIAGQFYDYSSDSGTVSMDRALFETWFGVCRPTHLALYLKPGTDPEAVRRELLSTLEGRGLVSVFTNEGLRAEVLRIFDATFAITWALEIIAILVAMAGVAATLLTLVLERRAELRLLHFAGASAGQLRRTILIESGLLGALSQALGLVVGLLLSLLLIHVINPQSFGWSMRFHVPWGLLAGATALTVLGTMLAGFWPARRVVLALLLLLAVPLSAQEDADGWAAAEAGHRFEFPRDHGSHPQHKIEWWYFTGNLDTAAGHRLGYQLTFFRIGTVAQPEVVSSWALRDVWMAHLAVTDVEGRVYHHADRLNRAGPGLAGATPERVWNEDWDCRFGEDGMTLRARDRAFGLELELSPEKAPVLHGIGGYSQKGVTPGNASQYYSLTRLRTRGLVEIEGERHEVTGASWMDHEFGSSFLEKGTAGWDWFSAQFDDGSELMLFQLRSVKGGATTGSAGTFIAADGSVRPLEAGDFQLTPGRVWTSPSGAAYPIAWRLEVPGLGLQLDSVAVLPQQEFQASGAPGLSYWEGAVDYRGAVGERPLTGRGYLEMTGYRGRSMSAWFGSDDN
jgi:putative ABC transport system permease protein